MLAQRVIQVSAHSDGSASALCMASASSAAEQENHSPHVQLGKHLAAMLRQGDSR